MSTLVIRFSSVGDIVLAGAITASLGDVVFLTLERYKSLAAALPGVIEVRTWEADGRSATEGFDHIIDLHASPRSRLATAFRSAKIRRVRRHDLRRRLRPALKIKPAPSVVERYAEAAGVTATPAPWLATASGDALLLIPGAAHPTKRWSSERFTHIGQRWDGPVIILGSQQEEAELSDIARAIGPRAEVLAETGFTRTIEVIRRGRVAIGGDTGLTHLAAASGVHTIGLFGPTAPDDGFWCHPGDALSVHLPCSPCSRHGNDHCPTQDHACMQELSVDQVWAAVEAAR